MNVFVAGGTGFVGRPLCRVLADRGHGVTAASRSPDAAGLPADVETAVVDVTDPDLTDAVAGHDAVVNLVALPSHVDPEARSHRAVHVGGTRHLLNAAEATGVDRFVQVSGLGVDAGVETAYFRAKRRAERLVREADLEWVIFRPSVVFGDGCAFLPFLERITPPVVTALPGGGRTRLQPIWVEDLAPMVADGVTDLGHAGEVYELGGPERLTLAEIVELVCDVRTVLPIPGPLADAGFALSEVVPGIPFSRDQGRALGRDNVTANEDLAAFGYREEDLTTLSAYLEGEPG